MEYDSNCYGRQILCQKYATQHVVYSTSKSRISRVVEAKKINS